MDIFITIFSKLLLFARNFVGIVNAPYSTYRNLAQKQDFTQTIFIFLLVLLYFLFSSVIRVGLYNPFFLTVKFNIIFFGAVIGFLGMILLLYYLGKLIGGSGKLNTIFFLWSFSLIPTLFLFLSTSILYVLLPPPRTYSLSGKLYSVVYIIFSFSLLWWKLMLYYLTLRFGHKLDFSKIAFVSQVIFLLTGVYSWLMYKSGVFRIPFI